MASKKLVSGGLAGMLVLTAMLSACSSSSNTSTGGAAQPGTSASDGKAVSLSIWTGWPELDPFFKKMADDYKKTKPNVSIEISSFRFAITKRK